MSQTIAVVTYRLPDSEDPVVDVAAGSGKEGRKQGSQESLASAEPAGPPAQAPIATGAPAHAAVQYRI